MILYALAGGWSLALDPTTNTVGLIFESSEGKTGVTLGTYSDDNPPMEKFGEAISLVRSHGETNTPIN